MNPTVHEAGYLYRNGACRCGACSDVEGPVRGGKRERKREGWTYDRTHGLGWVCPACWRRFVQNAGQTLDADPRARPAEATCASTPTEQPNPLGMAPRGFGLKRAPQVKVKTWTAKRREIKALKRRYHEAVAADTGRPIPDVLPRVTVQQALDHLTRRATT